MVPTTKTFPSVCWDQRKNKCSSAIPFLQNENVKNWQSPGWYQTWGLYNKPLHHVPEFWDFMCILIYSDLSPLQMFTLLQVLIDLSHVYDIKYFNTQELKLMKGQHRISRQKAIRNSLQSQRPARWPYKFKWSVIMWLHPQWLIQFYRQNSKSSNMYGRNQIEHSQWCRVSPPNKGRLWN